MYAQFSKKSLKLLSTTLFLSINTITDLDLSYSYINYYGAIVLRDILKDKKCNLIRLGLVGNTLNDSGVEVLCDGIKHNNSLIYCDLRSNNITNIGLKAIYNSITNTNNSHSYNKVLYKIDLRNNKSIKQKFVHNILLQLLNSGNTIKLVFDEDIDTSISLKLTSIEK